MESGWGVVGGGETSIAGDGGQCACGVGGEGWLRNQYSIAGDGDQLRMWWWGGEYTILILMQPHNTHLRYTPTHTQPVTPLRSTAPALKVKDIKIEFQEYISWRSIDLVVFMFCC